MGQPNKFRYFLTLDNERIEIIFSPDGWETDTVVKYQRDSKYFGLIRSLAVPLQFVLDGADIVRKAYYMYGVEAEVRLEVEQLQNRDWSYQQIFRGNLDFSKFKDMKDHVSITLQESGIPANVAAYDDVKFEYALTGSDVVNMILPGVPFSESSTAIVQPNFDDRDRFIPGTDVTTIDFKSGFAEVHSVAVTNVNDNGFAGSNNWFVKANRDLTINLKGSIAGNFLQFLGTNGLSIRIMDNNNNTVRILYENNAINNGNFEKDFDENIVMTNGQQLFLYARTNGEGNAQRIRITSGDITVSYSSTSDPSNCKGIRAFDLYKRIMAKVSPGAAVESYLLKNSWPSLIFTSGDGIREIDKAKIKISFSEFFDTINAIEDAGFGLESNVVRIEKASYFSRDLEILATLEAKDLTFEPATQFIFNSVKVGYDDGNTDETNGKEEYNSGQVWQLPISRVKTEKNWISPTRADQYGIEKIRVAYNIKKTEATKSTNDTSSDNDTFMVDCYLDGENYRPVQGLSYNYVNGLTGEAKLRSYNLELTPKKNLLRHSGYLRSIMDRLDGRYINFASGEKNTELETMKFGVRVKENENIMSSSLDGKYFLPVLATFTTKLPRNVMWLLDNMAFGYVRFRYNKVDLKGYIMEISVDIARNTEREFKLLLTNNNDLLKLI